ncbi:unnamed protein product, partial [Polarella glacialis]
MVAETFCRDLEEERRERREQHTFQITVPWLPASGVQSKARSPSASASRLRRGVVPQLRPRSTLGSPFARWSWTPLGETRPTPRSECTGKDVSRQLLALEAERDRETRSFTEAREEESTGTEWSVREVFKPQALRIVVSLLPALACVFAEFLGHGSLSTLLPRHLRDSCELDMEDAGWWSGSINSAQYFGVTL